MTVRRATVAFGISALFCVTVVAVAGQEPQGAANRAAAPRPWPPERLSDGQPDVQGSWGSVLGGSVSLTNPLSGGQELEQRLKAVPLRNPSRIIDPPDGEIPYQPWAAARQKQQVYDYEHPTKPEHIDTQHYCLIPGVPRLYYIVPGFKIVQAPGIVVFVWDTYHAYRVIPLDGRPHIRPNVKLWMGDSRGHWEGNTLVVDTTNLNGKMRLTYIGDFFTDKAHLVERMTFVDANTMTYEATITDPTVFTRPWTIRVAERRRADEEMWETACHEGETRAGRLLRAADAERK